MNFWIKKLLINWRLLFFFFLEYLLNGISDDAISRDSSPLDDDIDNVDVQSFTQLEKPACLYLFARADREKEEWYRRLKAGARSLLTSSTTQCPSNIPIISKPFGEVSGGGGDVNKSGEQYPSTPTTQQQTITLAERQLNFYMIITDLWVALI